MKNVFDYPTKIHFKILMDLAEFAKKEGKFDDA